MTDFNSRIEANPKIMFGKPCIKGTRIPVELVLEKLNCGWTNSDLLDAYPRIKEDDILACIKYGEKGFDLKGLLIRILN